MDKERKSSIKEGLFAGFWIYHLIRAYVFDVERYCFQRWHLSQEWLLDYRWLLLLLGFTGLWLALGTVRFWINFLHLMVYPLVWLFWRVPVFCFWGIPKYYYTRRQYISLFVYVYFWINVFTNLKQTLLKGLLLTLAALAIYYSNHVYILGGSAVILVVLLLLHLKKRFDQAFTPVNMFRLGIEMLNIKAFTQPNTAPDTGETDHNPKHSLETTALSGQLLAFWGRKIKGFLNQQIYLKYFVQKMAFTVPLVVGLLTWTNWALYKINPQYFSVPTTVGIFDFVHYTIYSIIPDGTSIAPIAGISTMFRWFCTFTGVFILIIFASVFVSTSSGRYHKDLTEMVAFSDYQIKAIQIHLTDKYARPASEMLDKLQKLKKTFLETIQTTRKAR